MTDLDLMKKTHKVSIFQLKDRDLEPGQRCVCFYCSNEFRGKDVVSFVDDYTTPLCPKCDVDSVIIVSNVEKSLNVHISKKLVRDMQKHYFY